MKMSRLTPPAMRAPYLRVLAAVAFVLCTLGLLSAQSVTLVPSTTKVAGTGVSGWNGDFGQAGTLQLSDPGSIGFDPAGNLFIVDKGNNCIRRVDAVGNAVVVAGLVSSTGNDTCNTASNSAPTPAQGLYQPGGITVDAGGNLYLSDTGHNCIRELLAGTVGTVNLITVAGTCGASTTASVTPLPAGTLADSVGNLYIAVRDTTDGIYQIVRHARGAAVTSVCLAGGAASAAVSTPCTGITNNVTLNQPSTLTFDPVGNIFFSDTANNCIRQLSTAGVYSTAIGTCGSASSAIQNPRGLVFSQAGNLFFVTSNPSKYFRYNLATGALLQVGGVPDGSTGAYSSAQGGAAASTVPLNAPRGIAIDANNNTYVSDSGNAVVRRFSFGNLFPNTATGATSVPNLLTYQINSSGNLSVSLGPDYALVPGLNTCTGAQTAAPSGATPNFCSVSITFSPTRPGRRLSPILITDSTTPSGSITTGLQGLGLGAQALLYPGRASTRTTGITNGIDIGADSAGNMYVLEGGATPHSSDIKMIPVNGGAPVVAVDSSVLTTPTALASDAGGNWYVADAGTNSVLRYSAVGVITPNYITGLSAPSSLYVDGFGNAIIGENGTTKDVLQVYTGGPRRVLAGGGTAAVTEGVSATSVALQSVTAVAAAPDGTVYIGDATAHRIYGVDTNGIIHIVAGNGTSTDTIAGTALGTGLNYVDDVDVDPAGDLIITDTGRNSVYMLYSAAVGTANITRVFGNANFTSGNTGDGAASPSASLNGPTGLAFAPDGSAYIIDRGNNALRAITFPNYPSYPLLDFGNRTVGSTSKLAQTLFNEGNTNLIRVNPPTITNAAFANDSATTTCGLAIVPGLLCNFGFSYTPAAPGTQTGTASIVDTDVNSPQVIGLRGVAAAPQITAFTAPAETEVYGGPYQGTVNLATNGGPDVTGTITFSIAGGSRTCTVTGTFSGTVTCTLPGGTLLPVASSPYPVVVTFTGNYPTQTATTTLTETPRPLTETVNDKTKQYLQANPTLTGTPNGIIAGVGTDSFTVSYTTTATQTSTAGKYPILANITPAAGTVASNYSITNTPGTLTVTAAAGLSFGSSAPAETEVYGGVYTGTVNYSTNGGVAPTGTFTFAVNGTTICSTPVTGAANTTCTNPAGSGLAVGTYTVTITYSGDANYSASTTTAALTVTRAPLTVTVNSQTKAFGAANPTLTGTVSGVVNGDTVGTTLTVAYSTSVTTTTPVGVYNGSITAAVTGSAAGNYNVTVVPGNFAVTNITTTLRLTTSGTPAQVGAAVTFTAVVTGAGGTVPNGPVVFLSDGTVIGTVNVDGTGTATIATSTLSVATHTITANYAGNANFGPSTATLTQVITAPVGSFVVTATPATQLIRGAGQTTYQITVTSQNGFSGPVALTCAGLPADANCTFAQSTVTLTANGTATTTMTTTTTLADAMAKLEFMPVRPGFAPRMQTPFAPSAPNNGEALLAAATMFPVQLGGLGLFAVGARRRKTDRSRFYLLALLLLTLGVLGVSGCGCPSSQYRAYPINITGTSTLGGPAASSTTVFLYVAQPNS